MFLEGIRDELLLNYVIAFQVVSMALAFLILTCNILGQAPYGRYIHSKWWTGPQLPSKPMWILQESPAVLVPAFYLFSTGKWRDMLIESPNANTALLLAVCAHYTYRYSLLRRMALIIFFLAYSNIPVACIRWHTSVPAAVSSRMHGSGLMNWMHCTSHATHDGGCCGIPGWGLNDVRMSWKPSTKKLELTSKAAFIAI